MPMGPRLMPLSLRVLRFFLGGAGELGGGGVELLSVDELTNGLEDAGVVGDANTPAPDPDEIAEGQQVASPAPGTGSSVPGTKGDGLEDFGVVGWIQGAALRAAAAAMRALAELEGRVAQRGDTGGAVSGVGAPPKWLVGWEGSWDDVGSGGGWGDQDAPEEIDCGCV